MKKSNSINKTKIKRNIIENSKLLVVAISAIIDLFSVRYVTKYITVVMK